MKNALKFGVLGLILGVSIVFMIVQIMRFIIPADTLNTYTLPTHINSTGAVELVIVYMVATILIGSILELLFTNKRK